MRYSAALLVMAALACSHAAVEPAPPAAPAAPAGPALGKRFSLRAGESARIQAEPVTLAFERILSDSRCAVDVVCVTAGEARASLRLERVGALYITFQMDTDRHSDVTVNGYRIALHSVSPAPRSTVQIDPKDYVVEVTVSR